MDINEVNKMIDGFSPEQQQLALKIVKSHNAEAFLKSLQDLKRIQNVEEINQLNAEFEVAQKAMDRPRIRAINKRLKEIGD